MRFGVECLVFGVNEVCDAITKLCRDTEAGARARLGGPLDLSRGRSPGETEQGLAKRRDEKKQKQKKGCLVDEGRNGQVPLTTSSEQENGESRIENQEGPACYCLRVVFYSVA